MAKTKAKATKAKATKATKAAPGKAERAVTAIEVIRKKYGVGVIQRMTGSAAVDTPSFSTGSLALDRATGIGGVPKGRIVEVYGPESAGKTTLCLHLIAEAQRTREKAAFVDAEHAFDPKYASAIGVDLDQLLISQPDYGEQALDVVDILAHDRMCSIIVVDSVAALTPKAELDGEMGQSHVGLQARMMSQAMRKLAAVAAKSGTTIVFINQLRMKIGVMFGCFHYDARVVLADGTTEKIGKIVNNRLPVRVRTFDPDTGEVGESDVIDWHTNGSTDRWLRVTARKAGGNGRTQFKVTPNHMLFTPGMVERPAGEVLPGDRILVQGECAFNDDQRCLAIGQILGDGSVRRGSGLTSQLRVGHGDDQAEYARWKASVFGELVSWDNGSTHFDLSPTCDLTDVNDGPELISRGGVRAVAVWAMDDGTFGGSFARWGWGKFEISCKRWTHDQREAAADALHKLSGVRPTATGRGLLWSGDRTRVFMEWIAPFVPPCMSRKLRPSLRRRCGTYKWDAVPRRRFELVPSEVLDVCEVPAGKQTVRFDLTVAGTHTYMVDGAAVHNSPETTPGGNALKFYASMRLDVRRRGIQREGEKAVATQAKVKVVKNKCAPPFREAEFDIRYGVGIDRFSELLDFAEEYGLMTKSGSWYSLDGERIGNGRVAACSYLEENRDVFEALTQSVRKKLEEERNG